AVDDARRPARALDGPRAQGPGGELQAGDGEPLPLPPRPPHEGLGEGAPPPPRPRRLGPGRLRRPVAAADGAPLGAGGAGGFAGVRPPAPRLGRRAGAGAGVSAAAAQPLAPRAAYRLWAPGYEAETAISAVDDRLVAALTPPLA